MEWLPCKIQYMMIKWYQILQYLNNEIDNSVSLKWLWSQELK